MITSPGIVLRITYFGTGAVTDQSVAHTGCGRSSAYRAGAALFSAWWEMLRWA